MPIPGHQNGTHEGIARYLQLYDLNLELAEAGVRMEYPQASPEEVRKILAQRIAVIRKEKWKGHGPCDAKQ